MTEKQEIITEDAWSEMSHDQRMTMIRGPGGDAIALQALIYIVPDIMAISGLARMLACELEAGLSRIDLSRSQRETSRTLALRDVVSAIRADVLEEREVDSAETSDEVGGDEAECDPVGEGEVATATEAEDPETAGDGSEEPVYPSRSMQEFGGELSGYPDEDSSDAGTWDEGGDDDWSP